MVVPKIEKQQVIGALKATGSSDPDVLFARKEEMLIESRRMNLLPTFAFVVGGTMCLTIIGAVVGIPIILFGNAVRKTIKNNMANAEQGLSEYMKTMGVARRATA